MKRVILFVHIAKTGGTSFQRGIGCESFWMYPDKIEENKYIKSGLLPSISLKQLRLKIHASDIKLVGGHPCPKLYNLLNTPCGLEFIPITIIRDPLDSAKSLYSWALNHKNPLVYDRYKESMGDIDSFCIKYLDRPKHKWSSRIIKEYGIEPSNIGLTSQYKKTIENFNSKYNLNCRLLKLNTSQSKEMKVAPEIENMFRERFQEEYSLIDTLEFSFSRTPDNL